MKTSRTATEQYRSERGLLHDSAPEQGIVLRLGRWCIAHRRGVLLAWVAVALVVTAVAGAVEPRYATNFSLPGTESQRASDMLTREFRPQSGDVDTIVYRVSRGTVDSPAVRAAIIPLLARVRTAPHVAAVIRRKFSRLRC